MDVKVVDTVVEQLTATARAAQAQRPVDPMVLSALDPTLVLPEFEGPLDLLLHLVRKHELDVFNIPISFITEQYLLALSQLDALNMDVAGEYLLMAATLAYIKSRELLPPEAQAVVEGEEGESEELGDPREQLVRRLLEYQKYKSAAAELASRPVVGRNVWTRQVDPDIDHPLGTAPLAEVPVWELIELLAKIHGKRQRSLSHQVTVERLSLADRINQIAEELDASAPLFSRVLVYDQLLVKLVRAEPDSDLMYQAVLTLLALLEMARLRLLTVYQAEPMGSIYVCRPGVDPLTALAQPGPFAEDLAPASLDGPPPQAGISSQETAEHVMPVQSVGPTGGAAESFHEADAEE